MSNRVTEFRGGDYHQFDVDGKPAAVLSGTGDRTMLTIIKGKKMVTLPTSDLSEKDTQPKILKGKSKPSSALRDAIVCELRIRKQVSSSQ